MVSPHLETYLNDHLAGSEGALELLEHLIGEQSDSELRQELERLYNEISLERQQLEALMGQLGIEIDHPRKFVGWIGEKLAWLKLQFESSEDGSMRLFEGLEALSLGLTGQQALWRALSHIAPNIPVLQSYDYESLIAQTEDQYRRVEAMRLALASSALVHTGSS
jgi:hypothetical protein